jgi:hypothetical protein
MRNKKGKYVERQPETNRSALMIRLLCQAHIFPCAQLVDSVIVESRGLCFPSASPPLPQNRSESEEFVRELWGQTSAPQKKRSFVRRALQSDPVPRRSLFIGADPLYPFTPPRPSTDTPSGAPTHRRSHDCHDVESHE